MQFQTATDPSPERLAERLKAVADPVRLRILRFLRAPEGPCCRFPSRVCACDLETALVLAQPTVSYHMAILTRAGLVDAEKQGRWVFYWLNRHAILELAAALATLAEPAQAQVPGTGGPQCRTI